MCFPVYIHKTAKKKKKGQSFSSLHLHPYLQVALSTEVALMHHHLNVQDLLGTLQDLFAYLTCLNLESLAVTEDERKLSPLSIPRFASDFRPGLYHKVLCWSSVCVGEITFHS